MIISTDRARLPGDFSRERVETKGGSFCPFCPGNEDKTPPEILAYRPGENKGNTAGWNLRVVPNKFPALGIEGDLDRQADGMFDKMNGVGAHEVVIETPNHLETLATMPLKRVEDMLWAFRDRILDLKQDRRFGRDQVARAARLHLDKAQGPALPSHQIQFAAAARAAIVAGHHDVPLLPQIKIRLFLSATAGPKMLRAILLHGKQPGERVERAQCEAGERAGHGSLTPPLSLPKGRDPMVTKIDPLSQEPKTSSKNACKTSLSRRHF